MEHSLTGVRRSPGGGWEKGVKQGLGKAAH